MLVIIVINMSRDEFLLFTTVFGASVGIITTIGFLLTSIPLLKTIAYAGFALSIITGTLRMP
jgi:hypothetical protein